MKAIVVYKSISGYTKKYAEWIADDLHVDIREADKIKAEELLGYDTVVFGGSLHAVGINGIGIIKRNWKSLEGKRLIVFATGASPSREEIPEAVLAANFTDEERCRIRFFYLRGGFDYGKLDVANKILMKLLKLKIRSKREADRSPDERGMLAAFDRPMDFTKRESVAAIVECAKGNGGK
jgi:menaquinone-dependent protoporphyrinogen IX oxidase